MNVNRRTQADRSAATRDALVASARPLFREHGFSGVGTEAIVRDAGVTRGALYHQFADKTELFAAVVEEVERDVNVWIGETVAGAGVTDPVDVMVIGARAWLEACGRPEVQRILLLDAPSVLGWERWREIGMRYGMGLLEGLLAHAIEIGRIPRQPVRPLAHVVIGALDEAALYIARADDQDTARAEAGAVVERLIVSLAAPPLT
jgi:AcrR family transcriptional regulator